MAQYGKAKSARGLATLRFSSASPMPMLMWMTRIPSPQSALELLGLLGGRHRSSTTKSHQPLAELGELLA
jgi:hypothetical protein